MLDWEIKFKTKYEVAGATVPALNLTLDELKAYNGVAPDRPMLLAVCGTIYDVSSAKQFYGPEGMYPGFAGTARDAILRAFCRILNFCDAISLVRLLISTISAYSFNHVF